MPGESKQEIMEATYDALCMYGFADLSIQKIADESDKGKSLIYYHYDDKEDLILSFLDFMKEGIEEVHRETMESPQDEKLDRFLDMALGLESEDRWEFQKAFLELRAYAAHHERFAEKFREMDEIALNVMKEMFHDIGIEDEEAPELILSLIDGAASRKVSVGDRKGLKELKEQIKTLIHTYPE